VAIKEALFDAKRFRPPHYLRTCCSCGG
jgi:hypothetical protein